MSGVDGYYPPPRISFSHRIGVSKLLIVFLIAILFLYFFTHTLEDALLRWKELSLNRGTAPLRKKF